MQIRSRIVVWQATMQGVVQAISILPALYGIKVRNVEPIWGNIAERLRDRYDKDNCFPTKAGIKANYLGIVEATYNQNLVLSFRNTLYRQLFGNLGIENSLELLDILNLKSLWNNASVTDVRGSVKRQVH